MLKITSILFVACLLVNVSAQAPEWGQCGGFGWTGPLTCLPGWDCTYVNDYHYQCLPHTTTTTTTTATGGSATPA
ncbi:hypothetical protein BDZ94DRAFT_1252857 [Collybia nuda]|uniref:CBM1 domain-containing protein n=1 Tax=Collybia nuda TaxID=64659 RepID=A0A9P6CM80_9AGAR|nr:hypothetical protein BDZ94DRAFT_1252857 [Collybia nuda]